MPYATGVLAGRITNSATATHNYIIWNKIEFHLNKFASLSLQLDFYYFKWVNDNSLSDTSKEASQCERLYSQQQTKQ